VRKTTDVSRSFSAEVVRYLNESVGLSLTSIANRIGQTRSFVSLVKHGERSLTVGHLFALQNTVGQPLPVLILTALEKQTPKAMKSKHKELYDLLRSSGEILIAAARERR